MKAKLLRKEQIHPDEWDDFIRASPEGAPYMLTAYMDIVAPDWQVLVVRSDRGIEAAMPLNIAKKYIYTVALQPPLSQFWGICFREGLPEATYQQYSRKAKLVRAIADGIPSSLKWISYNFAPTFDYPFPFHWKGFSIGTRYTYQLETTIGEEALMAGMASNTRYEIRKAEEWEEKILPQTSTTDLVALLQANARAGKSLMDSPSEAKLQRIFEALHPNGEAICYSVRNAAGKPLAAALFLPFGNRMIYLAGAQAPDEKIPGLMARVIWRGIRDAAQKSLIFDFEGSMLEGVESFFRGFGASPVPLLHIQKNDLPLLLRWIKKLR